MLWLPDSVADALPAALRERITPSAGAPAGLLDPEEAEELRELLPTMSPWARFRGSRRLAAHEVAVWQLAAAQSRQPWQAPRTPTPRGFRARYGGYMKRPLPTPYVRGTTCRVCGLYPFPLPAEVTTPGLPIGRQPNGAPFLFDALAWFDNGLISAPLFSIIGPNGFGKSTLMRQIAVNALFQGRHVMWLADAKPDGRRLCELLGDDGQIFHIGGSGGGVLNVLDPGALADAVARLRDRHGAMMLMDQLHEAQAHNVVSLVSLVRRSQIADYEKSVIDAAIAALYEGGRFSPTRPPILSDLVAQFDDPTPEMRANTAARSDDEFAHLTQRLVQSLRALVQGALGRAFDGRSTRRMNLDAAMIDVDLSVIPQSARDLRAAVIAITGIEAQEAIRARNLLASNGLARKTVTDIMLDELWQLFEVGGSAQIATVNRMTRLQRTEGETLGTATHTVGDYKGVSDRVSEQLQATGFISRSRVKFVGPINANEIEEQRGLIEYTEPEAALLKSWSDSGAPARYGRRAVHDGMGRFIAKWSDDPSKPGVPFRTWISPAELELGIHETSAALQHDSDIAADR
ncbi:ATP-binding protein [Nocardia wallacei]|uniref:ATP-binding protein n=1 Tax=Nocardia wallacei TaxID=480035 RepID=UPI0024548736|nr:ATP-binding protein [Nocardia wallacei]